VDLREEKMMFAAWGRFSGMGGLVCGFVMLAMASMPASQLLGDDRSAANQTQWDGSGADPNAAYGQALGGVVSALAYYHILSGIEVQLAVPSFQAGLVLGGSSFHSDRDELSILASFEASQATTPWVRPWQRQLGWGPGVNWRHWWRGHNLGLFSGLRGELWFIGNGDSIFEPTLQVGWSFSHRIDLFVSAGAAAYSNPPADQPGPDFVGKLGISANL
jgi:hypothetical protein